MRLNTRFFYTSTSTRHAGPKDAVVCFVVQLVHPGKGRGWFKYRGPDGFGRLEHARKHRKPPLRVPAGCEVARVFERAWLRRAR